MENSSKESLEVETAESSTEGNLSANIDEIVSQAVVTVQSVINPGEKSKKNGKTDVKKPKRQRLKNSPLEAKEKAFANAAKYKKIWEKIAKQEEAEKLRASLNESGSNSGLNVSVSSSGEPEA